MNNTDVPETVIDLAYDLLKEKIEDYGIVETKFPNAVDYTICSVRLGEVISCSWGEGSKGEVVVIKIDEVELELEEVILDEGIIEGRGGVGFNLTTYDFNTGVRL